MADINPYGGMEAFSSGVKSFVDAMQTGEDRKNKKMELDAKLKSMEEQSARQKAVDLFEREKFSQEQKTKNQGANVTAFAHGAKIDENGNVVPNYEAAAIQEKIAGAKMAPLADARNRQFNESQNEHAIKAGHEYEADPIIKTSKTNLNSLKRSTSILENPNKPVTTKDLNLAYNDYINAVAAGGAATEGKIHRELPETFETQWNLLKQKFGDNDDLRKTKAGSELIGLLKQNIATVNRDLGGAVADQAYSIHQNHLSTSNPKVIETSRTKLKQYAPDVYQRLYGGEQSEAAPQSQGLVQPGLVKSGLIGAPGAQQAPPAKPTTIKQNGVTYTLNPQTGQYE